jgi:flavin reductase (DIM6/NTAB) family NADH-FMN oxidoreductase RutF
MTRRPIVARVGAAEGEDTLREAFARWAAGVCAVAVRVDARVAAITATAFLPVSVRPPLILVSLGPNAAPRPFLEPGAAFGVSILAAGQRRVASTLADAGPVGREVFTDDGVPLVAGALAGLACTVQDVHAAGDHNLVIGRVEEIVLEGDGPALLYFRRAYGEGPRGG